MFLIRDLEGLTDQTMALAPGGMLIASLLDGRRNAAEVASLFAKSTGSLIKPDQICRLVGELDKSGLLETPAVADRRRRIWETFRDRPTRPASQQGTAYPADLLQLAGTLGPLFHDPKGPGQDPVSEPRGAPPLGLIAPHIDLTRGGWAYAWAYQALSSGRPPDLVVALGVAHMSPNSPWVLTKKAYETPYGPVAVDSGLYEEARRALWYDPSADEWVHRGEHSLEFQALWLKYLWRDKTPAWLPILCSSFDRFCPDRPPSTVETVEKAITAMGEALQRLAASGKRVLILAGIDLSHVGPRFGDELELNQELEKRIEAEDRKSLDHAMALQADEFYLSVVKDGHWRKVCGLSALYTGLRWMSMLSGGSAAGRLLAYGQAPDPMGGIVSFAGAVYPRP